MHSIITSLFHFSFFIYLNYYSQLISPPCCLRQLAALALSTRGLVRADVLLFQRWCLDWDTLHRKRCFTSPLLSRFQVMFLLACRLIHLTDITVIKNKYSYWNCDCYLQHVKHSCLDLCMCLCSWCIILELSYTRIGRIIAIKCLEAKSQQ